MFSKVLQGLRIDSDLTQEELARLLRVSRQVLSKYETGENEPNLDFLLRCSEHFNVSVDYLLGKAKISVPQESLFDFLNNNDIDSSKKFNYILLACKNDKKYIDFIYSVLVATQKLK
ncbi:MAG: helix-turn-helix transcriptional regulator [Clostridiaceae bacterium]